jgi:hypothetical protein
MHHSSTSLQHCAGSPLLHVRTFTSLAATLLLATLSSSVASASGHEFSVVSLPDSLRLAGPFGPTKLLDVNGDKRLDVVTTFGAIPVVIFAPSMSRVTLAISGCEAVDLAVWPGTEADDVLASTSSGVTRYHYVEVLTGGRPGYVATPLLGALFANSTSLTVLDLDGDGDLDIAALAHDGRSILRAYSDPSGALLPSVPLDLSATANAQGAWGPSAPATLSLIPRPERMSSR